MCQVLTTRARDQGSRPSPSSWPRPWARTSRHRSPAGLLRRPRSRHTPLRLIDPRRARLPRRQQEAQARHVPLRLRLPALRPRLPGLLPAQTRPRQTALGQAVLALAHRRILTLHAAAHVHHLQHAAQADKPTTLPTADDEPTSSTTRTTPTLVGERCSTSGTASRPVSTGVGSGKSLLVREKGLEPSRPKAPGPKPGASTNSATRALRRPLYRPQYRIAECGDRCRVRISPRRVRHAAA